MIKIFITIAAFIVSFFASAQSQGKTAQVNFSGRNCISRGGVCDMTIDSTSTNKTNMKAIKTYKQSENSIVIEVDALNLSIEDQNKIFGKEYAKITKDEKLFFVQENDFEFSIETLLYLDLNYFYKYLKKGNYPLEVKEDKIFVTLTLSRK